MSASYPIGNNNTASRTEGAGRYDHADTATPTPGPWHVDASGWHVFAGSKLVANCGGHQDNFTPDLPEINKANAALIAAAPDMLVELNAKAATCDRLRAVNAELLAALQSIANKPGWSRAEMQQVAITAIAKAQS